MTLDARTKLILIIWSNYLVFTQPSLVIESLAVLLIVVLMFLAGKLRAALNAGLIFFVLMVLYVFYPSEWEGWFSTMIRITANYGRQLSPIFCACALMILTTTIRELMAALGKIGVPRFVIIPLAITVRYFPSLVEDYRMTTDAIRLREIKGGLARIQALYITLLSSALNVSDEITAAAVTRGIENPSKKKFITSIKMAPYDYVVLVLLVVIVYVHVGGIL